MISKLSHASIIQIKIRVITMNKTELIDSIADKTDQAKADVAKVLDALMETIEATVAGGDKVLLVGFGTFEPQHRNARPGRNPQTGEPLEIAEATLPKFTPGKSFKERVVDAHKPKPKPAPTGKVKAKTEATTADKAKAKPKKA